MKPKPVALGAAAWMAVLTSSAFAAPIFHEPFDYFKGTAVLRNGAADGTGFTTPWSFVGAANSIVDGLTYASGTSNLAASGNAAFLVGGTESNRRFTLDAGMTTLYLSFIGQETTTTSGGRFCNVALFTTSDVEKVSIGHTSGVANPTWSVALNSTAVFGTTTVPSTTKSFVVVKLELNVNGTTDRASIYVNPPLGAEPATPNATAEANVVALMSELGRVRLAAGVADTRPRADMLVDELRAGTTWADVTPTGSATPPMVTPQDIVITAEGGSFTFKDENGAVLNTGRAGEAFIAIYSNPNIEPQVTLTKSGAITTMTFPASLAGGTAYDYLLSVPINDSESKFISGTFITPNLPKLPPTLPGPSGTVGTWAIREYNAVGGNIAAALSAINVDPVPAYEEGMSPVLNHVDFDTNGIFDRGDFLNDYPILTNTEGDTNFVVRAHTKVSIPGPGDYTFNVHSDDGFAMRVTGGRFISASRGATVDLTAIDPGDNQTLFFDGGTGDSNTRGVYHFDAAGTYDILYFGYDGGSGGFYELSWAPGVFVDYKDTNTWTLVGSPQDAPAPAPRFVNTLPGPVGTAGNFGVRTYLATGVNGLLAANDFVSTTTRQPSDVDGLTIEGQLPYLNAIDPQDADTGGTLQGNQPFLGNTAAADNNVVTVAKGRINIATAGIYTFLVDADDGFFLRVKGVDRPNPSFVRSSGLGRFSMSYLNELYYTGHGATRGTMQLAAGSYDLEFLQYENTNGFHYEIDLALGEWLGTTTPPNGWAPVGFVPSQTAITIPKIAAPGWEVRSSGLPSPTPITNIGTAEARIEATGALNPVPATFLTTWPELNFRDPEDGIEGTYPNTSPYPNNTAAAENDFAIRATGTLVVTEAGDYDLGFQGDDGGYIVITGAPGSPGLANPFWSTIVETRHAGIAVITEDVSGTGVNNRINVDTGTGNSRTVGRVNLTPGTYVIRTLVYETVGGAFWEVFGAKTNAVPFFVAPLLSTGGTASVTIPTGVPLLAQSVQPVTGDFGISNFARTGSPTSGVTFDYDSIVGEDYDVQVSTDLVNWTIIEGSTTTVAGISTASVDFTGKTINGQPIIGQPKLFIRVVRN